MLSATRQFHALHNANGTSAALPEFQEQAWLYLLSRNQTLKVVLSSLLGILTCLVPVAHCRTRNRTKTMSLSAILSYAFLAQGVYGAAVLRFGCSQITVERLDP